jgi:transposase
VICDPAAASDEGSRVPRADDREVLNGIFWCLRTGAPSADMFETVEAGHILLAHRAYHGDALRAAMAERGAGANIRIPFRARV